MAGHDPVTAAVGRQGAATPVRLCFRARAVTRVYNSGPAEVHALRGVDLDLPEGEMVVVLGASGSGKSTFLNILGGLDTPTSGEVLFRGEDISRADQHQLTEYRRRHVGFVGAVSLTLTSLHLGPGVARVWGGEGRAATLVQAA